jgi:outer membrane receptor protein involved in Fe transport
MYERGPWSARLAYNWRDKFLSSIASFVGVGAVPIYTRSYGWLDASMRVRINDSVSISLDANNLLGTLRKTYFGVPTRPQSVFLNDRQLAATVTVRI